jgi:hypothetical protein
VSLVNAVPFGGKKKGADGGIDGHIYFRLDSKTTEKAIVSLKGGDNVNVPRYATSAMSLTEKTKWASSLLRTSPPRT